MPIRFRDASWPLRVRRAMTRWTGWTAPPAPLPQVLALRAGRLPPGPAVEWTVSATGPGFSAVDSGGRRAVGMARGAAAVQDVLSALVGPAAIAQLSWDGDRPTTPAGRLDGYAEPPLGNIGAFLDASSAERWLLRAALAEVLAGWQADRLPEQIQQRVDDLNRRSPVLDLHLTDTHPRPARRDHDDVGRVRTFAWVQVDKVIGGGTSAWNDFNDLRPDTVPWIVQHVLGADDPERAVLEALTDGRDCVDLERIPGPAGPVYLVGNGRHRTHAMRILGVPLMAAEVTAVALPALVDRTAMRDPGHPAYPAEEIWRGLIGHGLLDGDLVARPYGPALQPYRVAAPWLLRSPRQAMICTRHYQQVYPGGLGVPADAFASVQAWVRWCVSG